MFPCSLDPTWWSREPSTPLRWTRREPPNCSMYAHISTVCPHGQLHDQQCARHIHPVGGLRARPHPQKHLPPGSPRTIRPCTRWRESSSSSSHRLLSLPLETASRRTRLHNYWPRTADIAPIPRFQASSLNPDKLDDCLGRAAGPAILPESSFLSIMHIIFHTLGGSGACPFAASGSLSATFRFLPARLESVRTFQCQLHPFAAKLHCAPAVCSPSSRAALQLHNLWHLAVHIRIIVASTPEWRTKSIVFGSTVRCEASHGQCWF